MNVAICLHVCRCSGVGNPNPFIRQVVGFDGHGTRGPSIHWEARSPTCAYPRSAGHCGKSLSFQPGGDASLICDTIIELLLSPLTPFMLLSPDIYIYVSNFDHLYMQHFKAYCGHLCSVEVVLVWAGSDPRFLVNNVATTASTCPNPIPNLVPTVL